MLHRYCAFSADIKSVIAKEKPGILSRASSLKHYALEAISA